MHVACDLFAGQISAVRRTWHAVNETGKGKSELKPQHFSSRQRVNIETRVRLREIGNGRLANPKSWLFLWTMKILFGEQLQYQQPHIAFQLTSQFQTVQTFSKENCRLGHLDLRFWNHHRHHHVFHNPRYWRDQYNLSIDIIVFLSDVEL